MTDLALGPTRRLRSVRPLHEESFVFDEMLNGWRDQQRSRGLDPYGVEVRIKFIRRFAGYCEKPPWQWGPGDLEDFTVRSCPGRSRWRSRQSAAIR